MEPKITKNIISYFDKEKYPHCVHDSAESENQSARSEEHTSELHHITISYAVFCLKKKKINKKK